MRFDWKYTFFIFIILFSFNVGNVYSSTGGVCCYDPSSSGAILPSFTGECSASAIELNLDFEECLPTNLASLKATYMRGCYDNSGRCYGSVLGKTIYEFPGGEVENYFASVLSVNLDSVCNTIDVYDSASCNSDFVLGGYSTGSNDNSGVGGSQVGNSDNALDYDELKNIFQETEEQKFCSNAGGPFGLFVSKVSCNTLTNDGQIYPCIYNPYLAGQIGISSSDEVLGLDFAEGGCVPKSSIKDCFDYKTQGNCEANVINNDASNYMYKTQNLKSCNWVETTDFFGAASGVGGYFNTESGICLSNASNTGAHFNINRYYDRKNLLKNPSFEITGDTSWTGNYNLLESEYSYDGKYYAKIGEGGSISQDIYDVGNNFYNFFLYVRGDDFYESENIEVVITQYPSGEQYSFEFEELNTFSNTPGIFKKVIFSHSGHKISNGTQYINFKIIANTDEDIYIDAVNFEYFNSLQLTTDNNFFKQLSSIPQEASSCEICFDENNLNFCTQKKSDLLGDCSYMVSDLSKSYISDVSDYLGEKENVYLDNSRGSQSIANSKVFCEMYLTQNTCLNPDNYVNSILAPLHYESEDKNLLCKWSEDYGCFKDSDNSGGPDTIRGGKIFLKRSYPTDLTLSGFEFFTFANYSFEGTATAKSDFAYSCDNVPPQSYAYFIGRDVNGEDVFINENFPTQTVGAVVINIDSDDVTLDSCEDYDIDKKIYVDFVVNDLTNFRYTPNTLFSENLPIKDFFVDESGNSLFVNDGYNELTIMVKDQSGNLGKVLSYNMDIDVNGPNITLLDPIADEFGSIGPLGPNSTFEFEISDYSNVTSCSFDLTLWDLSSNTDIDSIVDESYYDAHGDFNLSNMNGDLYEFDLPIYDTTSRGNYYQLDVTCADIFGQDTTEPYYIFVDYDTSFILMEPLSFIFYDSNLGFINGSRDVLGISTEKFLNSCSYDFNAEDGSGSLVVSEIGAGFIVEEYSSDINFYSNVTGDINFASDGVKDISINCRDDVGNEVIEDITYYYDTANPEFLDFSLISNSGVENSVVYVDGSYYTRRTDRLSSYLNNYLNFSSDGTLSWISTNNFDYSLKYFDGVDYVDVENGADYYYMLDEDSSAGIVYADGFDNLIVYMGQNTSQKDLYEQNYRLGFKDKAGNSNTGDVSYFYDDSRPDFVFGGDIYQDGTDLYTRTNNPVLDLSFNTPSYRGFKCSMAFAYGGLRYNKDSLFDEFSNNLSFKVSDVVGGFDVESESSFDFTIDCIDIYGFSMQNTFTLKYDNTTPVLEKIYLNKGNNIYVGNGGSNTLLDAISDKLVFDLGDTNEEEYRCYYQFKELDTFSVCDSLVFNKNFTANVDYKTLDLPILSDTIESICYRDRAYINPYLDDYYANDQTLRTKISVSGKCFDKVNLETKTSEIEVNVIYVAGNKFVDFEIDYNLDMASFTVTSLSEFSDVKISFDDLGEDLITTTTKGADLGDGLFRYVGTVDTSQFDSDMDSIQIWAVGFSSGGSILDKISNQFVVDIIPPVVEFKVLDADSQGFVYFEDFHMAFSAKDEGGSKLSSVELFVDDNLVFNGDDVGSYDSIYLDEPDLSKNRYSYDMSDFYGSLVFNGDIGVNYEFKLVATDGYGNSNEVIVPIYVKDGVGIRLLDSDNSVVDFDRFSWVTKVAKPTIKFETSKQVSQCSLYPFVDEVWLKVTKDTDISYTGKTILGRSDNTYEFSLDDSSFEKFDLNLLEEKQNMIQIRCKYNNSDYNFSRELALIDKLPDYVLSSSNGFVMNTYPYETILEVKSVGPHKYVTCSYTFEGRETEQFSQGLSAVFEQRLNFDDLVEGSYDLVLECEDNLGTKGPTKNYEFVINKNLDTQISDLKLFKGNQEYYPQDNIIYVNSLSGLGIEFNSNKREVNCNYEIKGGSGIYRLINFVTSLFVDNQINIDSTEDGFIYRSQGLDFSSGKLMDVSCVGFEEPITYNIVYMNSSTLDFNLN